MDNPNTHKDEERTVIEERKLLKAGPEERQGGAVPTTPAGKTGVDDLRRRRRPSPKRQQT